eukprot:2412108-Pleurochrysis_carterae.AAC.4
MHCPNPNPTSCPTPTPNSSPSPSLKLRPHTNPDLSPYPNHDPNPNPTFHPASFQRRLGLRTGGPLLVAPAAMHQGLPPAARPAHLLAPHHLWAAPLLRAAALRLDELQLDARIAPLHRHAGAHGGKHAHGGGQRGTGRELAGIAEDSRGAEPRACR